MRYLRAYQCIAALVRQNDSTQTLTNRNSMRKDVMKQRQLWMTIGVVLLTIGFSSAQRYTTIDPPGAGTGAGQGTFPQNITDSGLVFGYYVDSNGVAHGFLRSREGNYTKFDVSGAGSGAGQGTFPYSINPAVTITGQYIDSSNVIHGFIRRADGDFTTFDAPGAGNGAGEGTLSYNINPWERLPATTGTRRMWLTSSCVIGMDLS